MNYDENTREGRHLTPEERIALQAEEIKQLWQENERLAYNVGKVVEQLKEVRDELLHSTDYNNDIINYCLDWFDMAIDIVEGTVKDE
jgi:hypothetical protein